MLDDTASGNVGLALSQALILTGMLQYGMKQAAEVVNQMTSVERVLQYTQLEKEGPFESDLGKKPPKEWPSHGLLEFKQVYLRYSPSDMPVLKNLTFKIKPGQKVIHSVTICSIARTFLLTFVFVGWHSWPHWSG